MAESKSARSRSWVHDGLDCTRHVLEKVYAQLRLTGPRAFRRTPVQTQMDRVHAPCFSGRGTLAGLARGRGAPREEVIHVGRHDGLVERPGAQAHQGRQHSGLRRPVGEHRLGPCHAVGRSACWRGRRQGAHMRGLSRPRVVKSASPTSLQATDNRTRMARTAQGPRLCSTQITGHAGAARRRRVLPRPRRLPDDALAPTSGTSAWLLEQHLAALGSACC